MTRVNHLGSDPTIYDVKLRDHSEITRVLAHLKVCMGKRIVEVRLSECTDNNTLNTIDELFNGIQFRQLAVSCQTLSDAAHAHLFRTITDRKLDSIKLCLGETATTKATEILLLELSSLVESMYIFQYDSRETNHAVPYFLGHLNFNWGPLIHEMFSRKLDKLHIENRYYPKYLSRSCADLPALGKKVWFKATCTAYRPNKINEIQNDHCVIADPTASLHNTYLTIKHRSRAQEYF